MARCIIGSNVTAGGVTYLKGQAAELTSAQPTSITGASGTLRAVSTPGGSSQAGSPTHDSAGEAAGVSNSA